MRALAVIPARGGSKRVPGKNMATVGVVPLVGHAILSAQPCDQVVVSTDDDAIADFCYPACGIHRRLPEHATDSAQLEPVIDDVLASIDRVGAETHGIGIDAVVLLQPTSPFRTAAHVAEALRILRETGCDSVVSVTRLHSLWGAFNGRIEYGPDKADAIAPRYTPRPRNPVRNWEREWDDHEEQHLRADTATWPDRPPSSWLQACVYENGAVYAFTRRHWTRTRNRMGGDMRALVMHWSEAVEIDTPEDLEAARRLARG